MKKLTFILFSILLSLSVTGFSQQIVKVTSTEANKLITSEKKWVILDVRTEGEFKQGHIKGAINIDVHQSDAFDKYSKLDKNAKYMVYCRTQNRSSVVTSYMSLEGFKTIYQITDGITGWISNNLPLENL